MASGAAGSVPDTPLPSDGASRRVAFANQYKNYAGRSLDTASIRSSLPSQRYESRRPSDFILEHLSDMKHAGLGVGEKMNVWTYGMIKQLRKKWFTHCFLIVVMILYTVGGAILFLTIEGQNETKLIERDIVLQVKKLLKELRHKSLVLPEDLSEGEYKGEAVRKLMDFEKKITAAYARHPLVVSHANGRVWTIWNAIVYCSTLYTTIGYGHLYPTTFTGRVLTMVYSTIGIPLFLIALTDFGKLFTRGIKFVWAFVRRFYYTRSCRRVRRTSQVQDIIKGAQVMYEFATFRRASLWNDPRKQDSGSPKPQSATVLSEPQTPAISSFEIDDEFNLPVSLALTMLVAYMLIGAAAFMVWEHWDFFPAFYFVFMSLSTIGFGDIVPEKPLYMIISIVYQCFGLALMTMCINVVQDKLSETFNQASAKISETIGIVTGDDEDENEEKSDENDDDEKKSAKDKEDEKNKDEIINVEEGEDKLKTRVEETPFSWSTADFVK